MEEIERHLEPTTPVHLELGSPTFLDVRLAVDSKVKILCIDWFSVLRVARTFLC